MTKREIYQNLSELNRRNNKNHYVRNDVVTTIRGEEKKQDA